MLFSYNMQGFIDLGILTGSPGGLVTVFSDGRDRERPVPLGATLLWFRRIWAAATDCSR